MCGYNRREIDFELGRLHDLIAERDREIERLKAEWAQERKERLVVAIEHNKEMVCLQEQIASLQTQFEECSWEIEEYRQYGITPAAFLYERKRADEAESDLAEKDRVIEQLGADLGRARGEAKPSTKFEWRARFGFIGECTTQHGDYVGRVVYYEGNCFIAEPVNGEPREFGDQRAACEFIEKSHLSSAALAPE